MGQCVESLRTTNKIDSKKHKHKQSKHNNNTIPQPKNVQSIKIRIIIDPRR